MSTLEIKDLVIRFGGGAHAVTAADHVNLRVEGGSIVGLVGESGCGKSTLARAVVGLAPISSGEILLDGEPIHPASGRPTRAMRARRRRIQLVFQDPHASLDPRKTVGASIAEGVAAAGISGRDRVRAEVEALLDLVRLDSSHARSLPGALSGGQRQRVAIARALAAQPEVLIADEITSALDVSVQAAVLNLVRELQRRTGVSVLFISHNLAVVRYLADQVAVMRGGRVVESGATEEVIGGPADAYTRELIAAVPTIGGQQP
ncbi:MAG TPA: ABC transporter ATP-binding protein [Pseudonocardiaceae bacterium]|nr:ABC transporter ATP-binding protein [Pseudonocardiaceae bacterium]